METQQLPAGIELSDDEPSAEVIRTKAVRDALDDLKSLARSAKAATEEYAEACEAVATKANVDRGVLKAFITASVGDRAEAKKAKTQQLALLFDEIGA